MLAPRRDVIGLLTSRAAAAVLLAAGLTATGCSTSSSAPTDRGALRIPPPTEHRLAEGSESEHKSRRKAWMRERHRAAPGVDVKAVERRNGERQLAKRNQLAAMSVATTGAWTERGSRNQAGRVHVAQPSSDGLSLYAGSSKGGVWHGTLDGQDWEPLGDNIYGGAHWLAVVPSATPSEPDVIVRATDGGDVQATNDMGATWFVPAGLPDAVGVRRMLVTKDGSHTIFIMVRFWDAGQLKTSLYRSTDRGQSFHWSNGLFTYSGDVWAPRNGPGALYLTKLDKLYVSNDTGASWVEVGPLPASANGAELTGSEAGAPRLWLVLDESGTKRLYRSDNAGGSWTFITDVSDYWGTLQASIVDPDLFAWGGVEVHYTTNAGSSFDIVNTWGAYYGNPAIYLHADIPGMDVLPDGMGGEIWYVSTDGGLYRSTDGLDTVENLSLDGLRVSQYYTTHTSTADPSHVAAGAQDQGWQWADDADTATDPVLQFDQLISGDYGHATSGDGTHEYLYTTYPGFTLVHKGETNPALYFVDFPDGSTHAWLPPITASPHSNVRFFFCAERLYRFQKLVGLNEWSVIPWGTTDLSVTGNPGEYFTGLAFSPVDPERCYAATSSGRLLVSDDRAVNMTESPTTGPGAHYFYGTAVVASALDRDTAYVGGSGYSNPAVWRTTDGGATYQDWGQGLPSTLVYCMAEAADGSMFCGTETSAYRRDPGSASWVDIAGNEAPITTYWSSEFVAAENVIRFGTYGRGIWDYAVDAFCGYEAYGLGQGGSNVLALDTTSSTQMGTTHVLELSGGQPLETGYLLYAPFSASLPIFGGTLLVDPSTYILVPIAVDGAGELDISLPFPSDPILVDLPLNFQVALRDPGQVAGWALSNGLQGVVCP